MTNTNTIKRGDIYYADLSPVAGSEQGGVRPVVVVQNDVGNLYSPTTIVVSLTSRAKKGNQPTHVQIKQDETNGLSMDSVILGEQVRTIDKKRLKEKVGELSITYIPCLEEALMVSFGIK